MVAMPDDPRPDVSPQTAPPAQHAGVGKRRLVINAALIGATVPVVMTLSRAASANNCQSVTASAAASHNKACVAPP